MVALPFRSLSARLRAFFRLTPPATISSFQSVVKFCKSTSAHRPALLNASYQCYAPCAYEGISPSASRIRHPAFESGVIERLGDSLREMVKENSEGVCAVADLIDGQNIGTLERAHKEVSEAIETGERIGRKLEAVNTGHTELLDLYKAWLAEAITYPRMPFLKISIPFARLDA